MILRFFLLSVLLFPFSVTGADAEDSSSLFAFQNGVRFPSHEKRAEVLAELGFEGIGSASFPPEGEFDKMLSAYQSQGLRVFSFYTGGSVSEEGGKPVAGLYDAIPALKGSKVVLEIFLKGDPRKDHDDEAVAWVRELAQRASESDLDIALYPHTGMYIETIGDAVRIAKKVERDNVGVMFNLCHFLRVEPESDLRKVLIEAKPHLRQVSVSGADKDGRDWKTLIQPLGQGTYDVAPLLQILEEIGFHGPVGVQCYNIAGDPKIFLRQSIDAWEKLKK